MMYLTSLQAKDFCPAEVFHQNYCTPPPNRPAVGGTKVMLYRVDANKQSFIIFSIHVNSLGDCAFRTKAFCVLYQLYSVYNFTYYYTDQLQI